MHRKRPQAKPLGPQRTADDDHPGEVAAGPAKAGGRSAKPPPNQIAERRFSATLNARYSSGSNSSAILVRRSPLGTLTAERIPLGRSATSPRRPRQSTAQR